MNALPGSETRLSEAQESDAQALRERIVAFMGNASTEIAPHDEPRLEALANYLASGARVYVAHPPSASLEDVVRVAGKLQVQGFRAVPHIAARRIASAAQLGAALAQLRSSGVDEILLIAGDRAIAAGAFSSTLQILASGALIEAGFRTLGVAGHPEGHKQIGPTSLWAALSEKQEYAERTGSAMHIVTQFGFNPATVLAWEQRLIEHGITLPVHVGIAGPTPLPQLIRYAMMCGIGASLSAVVRNLSAMGNLPHLAVNPDEVLVQLVRGRARSGVTRIVQPHFFSFGGTLATARWMQAVMGGHIQVDSAGGRFTLS
jgi:methylenetetrahydrofolate reductase (NADPH)